MNLFHEQDTQDPMPDYEPSDAAQLREAATIADDMLSCGGWTGEQIAFLERVSAAEDHDAGMMQQLTSMRDARQRESNLKP